MMRSAAFQPTSVLPLACGKIVHIIDILLPGADVPDETIVKLGHLAVVPVHFGQKAVVHTVDADGFRKALLGADQYGIVKILKPAVNEFPPLVRLVVAAGDCGSRNFTA